MATARGGRAAAVSRAPTVVGAVIAAAGGLVIVGTLLPWVKAKIDLLFFSKTITVTGTQVSKGSIILACGFVICGAGLMMLVTRSSLARLALAGVAILGVVVIVTQLLSLLGQRKKLESIQEQVQKITNLPGIGGVLKNIGDQLKGILPDNPIHATVGPGVYLLGLGLLAAAVGGLVALVLGIIRVTSRTAAQPEPIAPFVAPGPVAAAWPVPPPQQPQAWPAAPPPQQQWPPPVQPPPAHRPQPPPWPPSPPAPAPPAPPVPSRGSQAPTVIAQSPTPPDEGAARPRKDEERERGPSHGSETQP